MADAPKQLQPKKGITTGGGVVELVVVRTTGDSLMFVSIDAVGDLRISVGSDVYVVLADKVPAISGYIRRALKRRARKK